MSPRPLAGAGLAAALLLAAAAPLRAQDPEAEGPVVVDRVVAVVGNHPILESEVQEQLFARQSLGLLPADPVGQDRVRRQLIDSLINAQLMLVEARQDTTLTVADGDVADAVQQRISEVRRNFPSDAAFQAELRRAGFVTPEDYRSWLTDQQRNLLLQQAYLQKLRDEGRIRPVEPSEEEMRRWFERNRRATDSLPALLSWEQIVVVPSPTFEAKEAAFQLADSIARELRTGADFATAARRFSMDPGSAQQGGSLGWFRRGQMVPQFEAVAFTQRPGTISNPVETSFGYHVIQVERAQPAEVNARHILIMPEITTAQADSTRARAERVRDALAAGASFDSLARIHHGSDEEREAKSVPVTQLPGRYGEVIAAGGQLPDSGQVFLFGLTGTDDPREKWVVARVTERRESGAVTFEDVRPLVRRRVGEELAVQRYAEELRRGHYIRIDDPE